MTDATELARLLAHMTDTSGWTREDPVTFSAETIDAAERRGWIAVVRVDGVAVGALLTARGKAAAAWGDIRRISERHSKEST